MSYFLWLLGGLAAAGAGRALRRRAPRAGLVLAVGGVLASVGAITWQVRAFVSGGAAPAIDRYSATVAYFMGHEVLNELRSFDGPVFLLLPPDRRGNQRELDSLFNTFARVLAPVAGLAVRDVTVAATDREIREGRVPLAAFEQALAAATGAVACVSFAGVPAGVETLPILQGPRRPLVFVYDPSGRTGWVASLRTGVLRRVIVARPDAGRDTPAGVTGPPDEIFKRHFLLAKPGTAEAVARELGTGAAR